jgi:hypothetical protein
MTKTLLDIVQDILSTLDSDTVDSISDTWEATQIANIVKNVYMDIVSEYGLPCNQKLGYLEGLGDTTWPTHLRIPTDVRRVLWWKYNKKLDTSDPSAYNDVVYLDPKEFVEYCNSRDSTDSTSQIIEVEGGVYLTVQNNKAPTYWTSFDNEYVICDSFDSAVDATLQQSKVQAYLEYGPTFSVVDTFVADLPDNLEQLFYRTCENTAYALFKQTLNPKLERKEHNLRIRAQRNKEKLDDKQNNFRQRVDFGR